MTKIHIRRPQPGDVKKLHNFFELVVRDTFAREGLAHMAEDMEKEIFEKKSILKKTSNRMGRRDIFL